MKKCLLKLYTHFLNSVICLLLFWSWVVLTSYIFWILVPYSDTKFADISSHSTSYLFFFFSCWLLRRLFFLHLVILGPWQRSFGYTCVNLFEIPFLRFIGLTAYFVAGRTLFWLLWHSYVFWTQEALRPHCSLLSRLFCLFGLLLVSISISILEWIFHNVRMTWGVVRGFNMYVHHF